MARSWTTFMLLLSVSEALRRKSKERSESEFIFPRRRRSDWKGPGFDSNGCIGPACSSLDRTEFDFIVVGSGAGGGAVAARLAEAGHQVLVLEAGVDAGGEYEYRIPVKHATSTETDGIAWHYYVQHYANRTRAQQDQKFSSKGILYPRGGALGGSTAVNAMINVLPKVSDWERIAALTNDQGWSPSSMNKYEALLDGWLPKDNLPLTDLLQIFNPELSLSAIGRLVKFFDSAFEEMGLSVGSGSNIISKIGAYSSFLSRNVNDELRKGNVEGAYSFPQMISKGNRHGSRERLVEALDTGKLTIKTQALVNRVVFSNAKSGGGCNGLCRATEVAYHNGRGLYSAEINPSSSRTPGESRVRVRRFGEIILSAGAFNTPQLLKQSGVGPKDELQRFNLPVHVDLVGVGENLQDRYEITVETEVLDKSDKPLDFISPADCNFEASLDDSCFQNWEKGEGLYATNGALFAMLKRSGHTDDSDLHIFGLPGPFRGYAPGYSAEIPKFSTRNKFSWVILKGHTDNRGGTVKLSCAKKSGGKCVVDPRSQPDINFHYFDEGREYDELDSRMSDSNGERDLEGVVQAVEFVRKINNNTDKALGSSKNIETWPGDNFASGERFGSEREKIKEWVKREAWGHHASCSAPMGCLPRTESAPNNWKAGFCKADNSNFNTNTVLSSRFTVRGTEGLRVVDASAFPRIPGTFLLLPTFMLGEKAAETILEDYDR